MRRFAVARETVRTAIRELLDKKLVERRHGYGTFLADIAKTKAAQKFAMIVPDAYYPFYARICRGIEDAAKKRGWTILSAALGRFAVNDPSAFGADGAPAANRKKALYDELVRLGQEPSYAAPTLFRIRPGLFALMANHEYGMRVDDAEGITAATVRVRHEKRPDGSVATKIDAPPGVKATDGR